jgi:hypothetical protein
VSGPFETEDQARELPAVRAVYEAFRADPGTGRMAPDCRSILDAACQAAGVDVGAYDDRILTWLSQWEPQMCAVIAGLITRAFEAGLGDVSEDTLRLDTIRGVLGRFDWEHDDRQYALERIERIADGGQP